MQKVFHFFTNLKKMRKLRKQFDVNFYLQSNPDVRRAGMDPWDHFVKYGCKEGRAHFPNELSAVPHDDSDYDYVLVRSELDPDYYQSTYPETKCFEDPVKHFCEKGWKENKNPNVWFDTEFYLNEYEDVRTSGLNPFRHFIDRGRSEGRLPKKVLGAITETKHPSGGNLRRSPQEVFDEKFYLTTYPDVAAAGVNPFNHFMSTGWMEGRNPNGWIDIDFYIRRYLKGERGVNPLIDYCENIERRPHLMPLINLIKEQALTCKNWAEKSKSWAKTQPSVMSEETKHLLDSIFKDSRVVISLSHDDYLNNTGGVQICIFDECCAFNLKDIVYLHFSPLNPLPTLADRGSSESFFLVVNINNAPLGQIDMLSLLSVASKNKSNIESIIVHSLLGFDPEHIKDLYSCLPEEKRFLWIHDFSILCSSHTLTRNNVSFCGGPPLSSNSCDICVHGSTRVNHLERINSLLDLAKPVLLAPSKSASDVFNQSSGNKYPVHVLPHAFFGKAFAAEPRKLGERIRVGFIGSDSLHKGWSVFLKLAFEFYDDSRYEFFHLGHRSRAYDFMQFVDVKVSANNRNSMVDALRVHEIDVALIWPLWPETFSFVAHEAIAAGCFVITNTGSGNIISIVEELRAGVVIDGEKQLEAIFLGPHLRKAVIDAREKTVYQRELIFKGITAEFERK